MLAKISSTKRVSRSNHMPDRSGNPELLTLQRVQTNRWVLLENFSGMASQGSGMKKRSAEQGVGGKNKTSNAVKRRWATDDKAGKRVGL